MMRAEARRAAARRLVRRIALLLALAAAVGGGVAYFGISSSPDATSERGRQVEEVDRPEPRPEVRRCVPGGDARYPVTGIVPDDPKHCVPTAVAARGDAGFQQRRLQSALRGAIGVLAMVAWLLGASLIGSEHQSGSLRTTLTVEPRRLRLFAAKALVAAMLSALLAGGVLLLTTVALLPAYAVDGPPRAGEPGWGSVAGLVSRGAAVAAIAAVLGFSIASVGRSTAAALGAGFAYLVVFENVLGGMSPGRRRWLLLGNTIVFISGQNSGSQVPGRSVLAAGLFLVAVAAAWLIGAGVTFRTRDLS